jgi:hypothetical protein
MQRDIRQENCMNKLTISEGQKMYLSLSLLVDQFKFKFYNDILFLMYDFVVFER